MWTTLLVNIDIFKRHHLLVISIDGILNNIALNWRSETVMSFKRLTKKKRDHCFENGTKVKYTNSWQQRFSGLLQQHFYMN